MGGAEDDELKDLLNQGRGRGLHAVSILTHPHILIFSYFIVQSVTFILLKLLIWFQSLPFGVKINNVIYLGLEQIF